MIGSEVPGFPMYTVTADGQIFSRYSGEPRPLKLIIVTTGYSHVTLTCNGKNKQCQVHRLVAETFIPNPDMLPHVNHKNGIKLDNRAVNLEWCTQSYNVKHGYQTGLRIINDAHKKRASDLGKAKRKLTVAQADEICRLYQGKRGDITRLSKEYGIDRKGIRAIVTGKAYLSEGV